jgi:hypothetical protein
MGRQVDPQRVAFWQQLISRRQRKRELSVAQLCEQAGVSLSSFYHWQQRLRTPVVRPAPPELVPVRLVADPPRDAAGSIEIELPSQVRLRVSAPCDPQLLRMVWELVQVGPATTGAS